MICRKKGSYSHATDPDEPNTGNREHVRNFYFLGYRAGQVCKRTTAGLLFELITLIDSDGDGAPDICDTDTILGQAGALYRILRDPPDRIAVPIYTDPVGERDSNTKYLGVDLDGDSTPDADVPDAPHGCPVQTVEIAVSRIARGGTPAKFNYDMVATRGMGHTNRLHIIRDSTVNLGLSIDSTSKWGFLVANLMRPSGIPTVFPAGHFFIIGYCI